MVRRNFFGIPIVFSQRTFSKFLVGYFVGVSRTEGGFEGNRPSRFGEGEGDAFSFAHGRKARKAVLLAERHELGPLICFVARPGIDVLLDAPPFQSALSKKEGSSTPLL